MGVIDYGELDVCRLMFLFVVGFNLVHNRSHDGRIVVVDDMLHCIKQKFHHVINIFAVNVV